MNAPIASNEPSMYSWAQASAAVQAEKERFNAVFEAEKESCLQWATKEVAHDHALIAARLDRAVRQNCLKVVRYKTSNAWHHSVQLLDEDAGEVYSTEIGGYIYLGELNRGAHPDRTFPFKLEQLEGGKIRIPLMITDEFPDHPFFLREDGKTKVDLGFNDNEHYYEFEVTLSEEDLADTF
jgi:hypothetical protein